MILRRTAFLLATALLQAGVESPAQQPPPGLSLVSRVPVVETDALFLSRPTEIAIGPDGHVYVTEANEARLLDIAPNGQITRAFGRKGQGPGEFMSPSTLAVIGDSQLVVHDRVQRRLTTIGLRSWKFEGSLPSPQAWPPFLRAVGSSLFVGVFDLESRTSVATVGPAGAILQRQGNYPEIGIKYPMLISGAFAHSAFAVNNSDVYALYEVAPSIFHWKLGTREATEIPFPKARRRGVDPSIFEQMLQDPGNQERNQKLAYDRSIPVTMEFVAAGVLAAVTMDYSMQGDTHGAEFHVSILDLVRNRSCIDLPIPIARNSMSMRDGIPRIAMRNDVLVVLEQGLDTRGESAPTLSIYRVEPASCL